jgi:hypothetical protein
VKVYLGDSGNSGQGPIITAAIEPIRFFFRGIGRQNEGEFMFLHNGVFFLVASCPYLSLATIARITCGDSGRRCDRCPAHGFQDSAVST